MGLGLSVLLGSVDDPALAGLAEGERILMVEPNELQAEAIARRTDVLGRSYWFGELESRDAIQVIYTGPVNTSTEDTRHS